MTLNTRGSVSNLNCPCRYDQQSAKKIHQQAKRDAKSNKGLKLNCWKKENMASAIEYKDNQDKQPPGTSCLFFVLGSVYRLMRTWFGFPFVSTCTPFAFRLE